MKEGRNSSVGKIIFANQLRAVAAVCVVIVHLLGSYWLARDTVAHHIFAPVLQGPSARTLQLISPTYFNFGPFGVALFFLVSGFVIPFSLAKSGGLRFLAARALRIYPTYIVCLLLGLTAVWLSSRFWGVEFGWSLRQIFHNMALVHNITGIPSIDMLNWSLAIEIKFYLIACAMAFWIVRGRVMPLMLLSFALVLLTGYVTYLLPANWSVMPLYFTSVHMDIIAHDLLFIPFMLIGTIFSYAFRGLITRLQLIASTLALLGIFIAAWPHTAALKELYPLVPLNYFYAYVVFSAAYACRRHFRPIKPLDWIASISYPVYVMHALIGYAALRFLTANGMGYYAALATSVALIVAIAYAVHRVIEVPTQKLGQRIMKNGMRTESGESFLPAMRTRLPRNIIRR